MAEYIKFTLDNGDTVLVEVEDEEIGAPKDPVQKAGLKEWVLGTGGAVAEAQLPLDSALERAVKTNADALIRSVRNLAEPPDTVEVTFGLKATGEAGNFAIGKLAGEVNYAMKLTWKPSRITPG